MENTRRRRKPVSAGAIARLADEARDVSRFFTNKGRMMGPIQRVNVDLASGMLEELDRAAKELNISRQAVIKTLIRKRSISNIWREEAPPPLSGDSPESLRQSASPDGSQLEIPTDDNWISRGEIIVDAGHASPQFRAKSTGPRKDHRGAFASSTVCP